MTERELLAIVETLKEFRNILLGQRIVVHTDHKNLTCKNFNTDRVMRWRLILEEYGPELRYIQGEQNIVADAISRIEMENQSSAQALSLLEINEQPDFIDLTQQECFYQYQIANNMDEEEYPECPVDLGYIREQQSKDKKTQELLNKDEYNTKIFHGGGKSHTLICKR